MVLAVLSKENSFNPEDELISIRGARVHNLKNIDVFFPLSKLTVITGVSGSGKSSIAFDTVYAEGQRRYIASLSPYIRQFLEKLEKPDADEIINICPTLAVKQKGFARNPRSTVATQTEILDFLRLLFARIGRTFCSSCGKEIVAYTPQLTADVILKLPEKTKFYILFPIVENSQTSLSTKAQLMSLMQRGFTRLYYDGEIVELASLEEFSGKNLLEMRALVDRLVVQKDLRARLVDSLEIAFREGNGKIEIVLAKENPETLQFSNEFKCQKCSISYFPLEPHFFSFNSPHGACPTCNGFGNTSEIDKNLVIPNRSLTLEEGAIEVWTKSKFDWAYEKLCQLCALLKIPMDVPFDSLSKKHQEIIWKGSKTWRGIDGFFNWLETKKYKIHVRAFLAKYRRYRICPSCNGARFREEIRAVQIEGKNLPQVLSLSIAEVENFFSSIFLFGEQATIAANIVTEIKQRLRFLKEVGLDYLTLDRLTSTLSGGESQRIQLATHLGSALTGVLYVLDEPSIGLHPRDNHRLIKILQELRDLGNTVLVVEHDAEMMHAADYVIDVGPGAGERGGEIVFQGKYSELMSCENSLTTKYLRQNGVILEPRKSKKFSKHYLKIYGANKNNLANIDVQIPLRSMVCITGVSGSGKSTLVFDVLYKGLKKDKDKSSLIRVEGSEYLNEIICVDQSAIGRTPRSNSATYIKVYDTIRELFASTSDAKSLGYSAKYFSFNVEGGRCKTCKGDGTVTVEMQFLADVSLLCESCNGKRFKSEILEIKYRGKNISEVLDLTVREALTFFSTTKKIIDKLKTLESIGLGYLRLGQPTTTLSGGESQRLKLATHLIQGSIKNNLYIFDEPTTGLHFDDVRKLLFIFRQLLDSGASLIVIEHNLDVIKSADWIIDLGPEGGPNGGQIVGSGTPKNISKLKNSYTGKFLHQFFSN